MSSSIYVYNDIRTGLESIFRSRLQMQILLSLEEGCKTLSDLREITGSSSQALLPKIRLLEKRYFISAKRYQYCLTPLGKLLEIKIAEFTKFFSVITHHDEFWRDHFVEGIPDQFINEMSNLYNSKIIADTDVEIFQVYSYYQKILEGSERIHWISSIINKDHLQTITTRVLQGIPVEMIVDTRVGNQLKAEPYSSMVKKVAHCQNYHLYVTDDPLKLGLMISENDLLLGLYKDDMLTFDASSHFISSDSQALSWGERLFSHFKDNSLKIGTD